MTTEIIEIVTELSFGSLTIGVSSFDIPTLCRRIIEEDKLTLEFTYFTTTKESLKKKKYGSGIRVYRGKNSGRIHKIQILNLSLLKDETWHEFIVDSILSSISSYVYGKSWHEHIIKQAVREVLKPFRNKAGLPTVGTSQLRVVGPAPKNLEEPVQNYFPETKVLG